MRRVRWSLASIALLAVLVLPVAAHAQAEPFIGQLMLVPYGFCPNGWFDAAGQLLPISQNTALFSLIGTTYGGNGINTFALPDLRGRVPVGVGQGPGLQNYDLGEVGGAESHTLLVTEMPSHSHTAYGSSALPTSLSPAGKELARQDRVNMYTNPGSETAMASKTIGATGGSQPFDLRNPFLGLRWCIAMFGIFPSRP